jgi:hypothetical protein
MVVRGHKSVLEYSVYHVKYCGCVIYRSEKPQTGNTPLKYWTKGNNWPIRTTKIKWKSKIAKMSTWSDNTVLNTKKENYISEIFQYIDL